MLGIVVVLLSSIVFCFQNVIVKILFEEQSIFGLFQLGGYVTPDLQHSFLLMFMRMATGVPLMAAVAHRLYPATWRDVSKLRSLSHRSLLLQTLGCGVLMFCYLSLLYISIGLIPTGIAITLFFTYPAFTALLAWRWFGDRLNLAQWAAMGAVFAGSYLTIPQHSSAIGEGWLVGSLAGLASGITYAFYAVIAQKSFEEMHPIPFTWLSFTITLILSGASLLLWNLHDEALPWTALWIAGLISAIVTFAAHILNNIGIRLIGATFAAIIAATNPALTAVFAWAVINETLNGLQIAGVIIATLSIVLLSWARQTSR